MKLYNRYTETRFSSYRLIGLIGLLVIIGLSFSGCSHTDSEEVIEFHVGFSQVWKNGRNVTKADPTSGLSAPTVSYPNSIYVIPSDGTTPGTPFTISPKDNTQNDNSGYIQYHESTHIYTTLTAHNLSFQAYWPGTDMWTTLPQYSDIDYILSSPSTPTSDHIFFSMAHQMAMIRCAIKTYEGYNDLRTVKLVSFKVTAPSTSANIFSSVTLSDEPDNGNALTLQPGLTIKTQEYTPILMFYVNPSVSGLANKTIGVEAVYDIYDKDGQITRKNCTSTKTFSISSFTLAAGKYYDILILLDPEFLFVLSDNDDTSDLILQ